MGCWTIRQETHQAAGSRTCEKQREAKTAQIRECKGARWIKKCNKYRARIGFRGEVVSWFLQYGTRSREGIRLGQGIRGIRTDQQTSWVDRLVDCRLRVHGIFREKICTGYLRDLYRQGGLVQPMGTRPPHPSIMQQAHPARSETCASRSARSAATWCPNETG